MISNAFDGPAGLMPIAALEAATATPAAGFSESGGFPVTK